MDVTLRRKFPFLYSQPDIPADKAKVVARLDIMKLDGWRALESMTLEELDELQAEAEGAIVSVDEFGFTGFDNEHDKTIIEAREAIKMQRIKTRNRKYEELAKQDERRDCLVCAALSINKALNMLEKAQEIEPDPKYCEGLLPRYDYEIDPSDMTDGELDYFVRHYDPSQIANPFPDHSVLNLLKTPAAKTLAAEVKKHNEAFQERYEIMRTNYGAARAEQSRRRDEARAKAETLAATKRQISETDTSDVIADLMSRIEELEGR